MLILERKSNETIIIESPSGDIIEFQILESTRTKAKVGINAPEEYLILRNELVEENEFISE